VMCPPNCVQGVQESFEGKKVSVLGSGADRWR
jgi:hypothetical protein